MMKFEHTETYGWEAAVRGMRNPLNSWHLSDSMVEDDLYLLGNNDLTLMKKLRKAGTDHRKYLRMINVSVDITAPLYVWKEFDTYKVGTVANSCSTMHKIMAKEFELKDFSIEYLSTYPIQLFQQTIDTLNTLRELYLKESSKEVWYQVIQLLPSSYNQKRTVVLNYEVLNNMYHSRKNHKLDEWSKDFCNWVEKLPYAKELIICDN